MRTTRDPSDAEAPKSLYYGFYHSFMKSLLTLSFLRWFYGLSKDDNSLSSTVKDHRSSADGPELSQWKKTSGPKRVMTTV